MINIISLIIPIVTASVSFILGLVLLLKKEKSRLQVTILFSTPWVITLQIGTFLLMFDQGFKILGWQLSLISLCLLTPLCTKLAILWGKSNGNAIPKKFNLVLLSQWLISIICIGDALVGDLITVKQDTASNNIIVFANMGKFCLIYLIVSSALILSIFDNKLKLYKNIKEIRIPTIIFMGIFVLFIIIASQGLLIHTFNPRLMLLISTSIFVGYLIPISSRVKNYMSVDKIVDNREAVYSSFMILLVGAYLIVIGIIGKLIFVFGGNVSVFFSVIAASAVIVIFFMIITSFSLKERIRKLLNKSLFRGKFDYRAIWSRFSEEASFFLNLDELINSILNTITDILHVDKGAVLLLENNSRTLSLVKKKICLP